jgi:hypothetical protein
LFFFCSYAGFWLNRLILDDKFNKASGMNGVVIWTDFAGENANLGVINTARTVNDNILAGRPVGTGIAAPVQAGNNLRPLPYAFKRTHISLKRNLHSKRNDQKHLHAASDLFKAIPSGPLAWCDDIDEEEGAWGDNCVQRWILWMDDDYDLCDKSSQTAIDVLAGNRCQLCDGDATFNLDIFSDTDCTADAGLIAALKNIPCCNMNEAVSPTTETASPSDAI